MMIATEEADGTVKEAVKTVFVLIS